MRLSRLERVLRLFTDVRPGEGGTALLMFANVFLILCAYYFIKPLREGWIAVSEVSGLSKMEVRAYSSFGQSLLLVPIVAGYSRLVNRWDRATLITFATLFCMSNMLIFWCLQPGVFFEKLPLSGIVFYLWVGMFGVFVVAQFWAFAADVYDDSEGRRLMPMIAIGATAGAAFGSEITAFLVDGGLSDSLERLGLHAAAVFASRVFRSETLLIVALVPLLLSILLTRAADRRRSAEPSGRPSGGATPGSGLSVVMASRFLLAVAFITVLLNWVNTNGENLLFRVVQEYLTEEAHLADLGGQALLEFRRDGTTAFYGNFYSLVNLAALVLQAVVASRLLKYGGFGAILLLLPVVALTSYATMALVPVLAIVKVMKVAENSVDYSINNTARHVLWLPVPSASKFKGKPTIDSFFVRVGDGFAALTVLVGVQVLSLATETFFVFNVVLVLIWLGAAVFIVREHGRLTGREAPAGEEMVADAAR